MKWLKSTKYSGPTTCRCLFFKHGGDDPDHFIDVSPEGQGICASLTKMPRALRLKSHLLDEVKSPAKNSAKLKRLTSSKWWPCMGRRAIVLLQKTLALGKGLGWMGLPGQGLGVVADGLLECCRVVPRGISEHTRVAVSTRWQCWRGDNGSPVSPHTRRVLGCRRMSCSGNNPASPANPSAHSFEGVEYLSPRSMISRTCVFTGFSCDVVKVICCTQ